MSTVPPASETPPLFGQPRGLTVFFLTQMWETLSCYGMRALLVYYMTQQLLFGQQKASMIYGVYTAMVFFTPIIGGVISNCWLGHRRAVLIGSNIMALWAATDIDHQTDGFLISMTWFQALNPLFVILLTPLLLVWWAQREKHGGAARSVRRMATGAIGVALGMAWASPRCRDCC